MEKFKETETPCYKFCNKPYSNEAKSCAEKCSKLQQVFLNPVIGNFLKTQVPNKRYLDIGCGTGYWCYQAAICGAKSVDGFDKQEGMVKLAQQATSQLSDPAARGPQLGKILYEISNL